VGRKTAAIGLISGIILLAGLFYPWVSFTVELSGFDLITDPIAAIPVSLFLASFVLVLIGALGMLVTKTKSVSYLFLIGALLAIIGTFLFIYAHVEKVTELGAEPPLPLPGIGHRISWIATMFLAACGGTLLRSFLRAPSLVGLFGSPGQYWVSYTSNSLFYNRNSSSHSGTMVLIE
jgi:hypothetical protein